jgi:hypothetical protein
MLAALAVLTDVPRNLAQSPQSINIAAPVPELPGKRQGLGVVLAGLTVLTDEPLHLAQSPQRFSFTAPITQVLVDSQCVTVKVSDV